jgi:hypothetical protein
MHSQESQIVQVNLEKFIAQVEKSSEGDKNKENPAAEKSEGEKQSKAEKTKAAENDEMRQANGKTAQMKIE